MTDVGPTDFCQLVVLSNPTPGGKADESGGGDALPLPLPPLPLPFPSGQLAAKCWSEPQMKQRLHAGLYCCGDPQSACAGGVAGGLPHG